MAINKVDFGGRTLIDLTGDTLTDAAQLLNGITAHSRDGSQITGTFAGQTKSVTPTTSAQNVTPDTGKWLSQVTVGAIPSEYIVPSGTKTINANGTGIDVAAFAKATVNVKDSEHYAYGYKTMTANADFLVTGIVDQQGNTFTPKGYAFFLAPNVSSNTNITSSTHCLVICYYDVANNKMNRNITYTPAYTVRINPGVSSGSVGSGRFEQSASSNALYNVMGQRYFWIAWG